MAKVFGGSIFWVVTAALCVGYFVMDGLPVVDVVRIAAVPPENVASNRAAFEADQAASVAAEDERFGRLRRDAVIAIYGEPLTAKPVRYVLVDEQRLIRPAEDNSLALLPWHEGDEEPLIAEVWGYYTEQLGYAAAVAWLLLVFGADLFARKKGGG